MKSNTPINFLGLVDKSTGMIKDDTHELNGKTIKNSILVFPGGRGSSVGAYTIYSLFSNKSSPKAMICLDADSTVVSGCAIGNIPLVIISKELFDTLYSGDIVDIDTGQSEKIKKR